MMTLEQEIETSAQMLNELYLEQGIDAEISRSNGKTTVELSDLDSKKVIAVMVRDSLSECLVALLGKFAGQVRDIKTGRTQPKLTEL